MWTDNETAQDFLNFRSVAATVAEIIDRIMSEADGVLTRLGAT